MTAAARACIGAAALLATALPDPAGANGGVPDINQTCATVTGCVAGDAPGFPVTLGAGSFRLSGSLSVTDPALDAIELTADGTTLDLNGFEVAGPVSCTGDGSALSCQPAGAGVGIDGAASDHLVVRRGSVRGFGFDGVSVGAWSRVQQVSSEENGEVGIRTRQYSIVTSSRALRNGHFGIYAAAGSIIADSIASANFDTGFIPAFGSALVDSVSRGNGENGTELGSSCVLRGSSFQGNEDSGIVSFGPNAIGDNSAVGNGGAGIRSQTASSMDGLVHGNVVRSNLGVGIELSSASAFRENTISANSGGTVSGGVDLGANSCNATTSCP